MSNLFPTIGQTRLVKLEKLGQSMHCNLYAKMELQNPTHSHKDRESRAVIEDMLKQSRDEAVIASTGNAAISLAMLGKSIGLKVHVFYSSSINVERRKLLEMLRIELHKTSGGYGQAIRDSELFAKEHGLYVANPGNAAKKRGDREIGEEIVTAIDEELTIVVPTNNGTLLSGIWEGVKKVKGVNIVAAVAPETKIADSIAGFHQLEGTHLKEVIHESDCKIVDVTDNEIGYAMKLLAIEGIYCEAASAASLAAVPRISQKNDNIVLIITGSAFKFAKKELGRIF